MNIKTWLLICLVFLSSGTTNTLFSQTVYYSDQFYGGVTTGAFSLGTASSGSGSFTVNIPAGSTIHQAYFFGTRTGVNAPPVTVQLNGTPYTFNATNQIGNNFNSLYGGLSATHAIDVTANILPATTNYTIISPAQSGVSDKYTEFYLYIAYENLTLPEVNTIIYISELDCQGVMNYTLNTPNPINTANPVGFAILAGYAAGPNSLTDCEDVTVNGTLLGSFSGFDFNAASTFGSTGTFEYYNNVLNGLGDDDENQAIQGPDVTSDISNVIPNNTTSIPVTLTHCPNGNPQDNMIWLFFLTYSNDTCGFLGLNLGPDTTLCQGQSYLLDATVANATYLWQDGSTNPTFNVTTAGTYYVEINVNGCLRTDSINVGFAALPVVTLGNDTTLCQGDILTLDATQLNATYLWQDASTGATLNVSQAGIYWVQVTISGCSSSDTVNVAFTPLPLVSLGNDTLICQGQSLTLDATIANGSYLWQDGSTGATYNVTGPGTYNVVVTANGCSNSDSITVNFAPLATVSLGNDTTLCQGASITIDVTIPNATYSWQDNSTNPVYTISQAGTYWVNVTNYCGTVSDTITVTINPLPVFTLGNDTTLCDGEILVLDATLANGSYLWQDGSSNATYTVTQQGTYYVLVTVAGCSSTDSVTVNYNPLPAVNLGADTTLCAGETLLLNATTPNGSYVWQDLSTNPTYTVLQSGTYFVSVSVNGCSTIDSITVNFTALPVVNLGADTTLCQGDVLLLNVPTFNGTFVWQDGSTGNSYTVNGPGVYWVVVTENNCSNSDTISVFYNALPVVNLGNDTTICTGQSILLDGTNNNATYLWQDGTSGATIVASQQGTYWVQVTIAGCTSGDTINVNVTQLANVNLGPDTTICFGDLLMLNITTPGATYLWQNGNTTGELQVGDDGQYWVLVNLNGCSTSDSITVVTEDCEIILTMPNIFTPNGDGMNDNFTPIFSKGITSMETIIFNRWGREVYSTSDLDIDWNGKSGGTEIVDGIYFWVVNYTGLKGKTGSLQGTVTLVKSK